MATSEVTTSVPEIPIHLNDGDGEPLRCSNVIPLNGTRENTAVCGAVASFVCEDCGPFCSSCRQETRCFFPDHQHRPISKVVRNAVDVLTALLAHRITPTYGLILLEKFNAPAWMIARVKEIEAEYALDFQIPTPTPVSPLRRIAAAELDKRKKAISADQSGGFAIIGNGLYVRTGKRGAR